MVSQQGTRTHRLGRQARAVRQHGPGRAASSAAGSGWQSRVTHLGAAVVYFTLCGENTPSLSVIIRTRNATVPSVTTVGAHRSERT